MQAALWIRASRATEGSFRHSRLPSTVTMRVFVNVALTVLLSVVLAGCHPESADRSKWPRGPLEALKYDIHNDSTAVWNGRVELRVSDQRGLFGGSPQHTEDIRLDAGRRAIGGLPIPSPPRPVPGHLYEVRIRDFADSTGASYALGIDACAGTLTVVLHILSDGREAYTGKETTCSW